MARWDAGEIPLASDRLRSQGSRTEGYALMRFEELWVKQPAWQRGGVAVRLGYREHRRDAVLIPCAGHWTVRPKHSGSASQLRPIMQRRRRPPLCSWRIPQCANEWV
jgi:hypothetical protein